MENRTELESIHKDWFNNKHEVDFNCIYKYDVDDSKYMLKLDKNRCSKEDKKWQK